MRAASSILLGSGLSAHQRMAKKKKLSSQPAGDHRRWLDDYSKASAWLANHDVEALLARGKGLAKISKFLPDFVAEGVLRDLAALPAAKWNDTSASDDYTHNNISHSFSSVRQGVPILDLAVRAISLLMPGELNSFSAARYTKGDNIAPHDDRAYTQVMMEDGSVIAASRNVACIWYLTKDWKEQYGGLLVDLEDAEQGRRTYVPEFNSAIIFRIPRWHQVTPMASDAPPRFTVFGWFLLPGKRYKLNLTALPPGSSAVAPPDQQHQGSKGSTKRKARAAQATAQVDQQEGLHTDGHHPQVEGQGAAPDEGKASSSGRGAGSKRRQKQHAGASDDAPANGHGHAPGGAKMKKRKEGCNGPARGGGGGDEGDDGGDEPVPFPGPLALPVMAKLLGKPVAELAAVRQ